MQYPRQSVRRRLRIPRFFRKPFASSVPVDAEPCVVVLKGDFLYMTGSSPVVPAPSPTPTPTSVIQELSQLPSSATWAVRDLEVEGDLSLMVSSLASGAVLAVSDGSFRDGRGTAAWVLEGVGCSLRGSGLVPGDLSAQGSYRSELVGLYGLTLAIRAICKIYSVTSGSLVVRCDGQEALARAFGTFPLGLVNHRDLIEAIRELCRQSPLQWIPLHIKGHQDDSVAYKDLDRASQLNVDMDRKAKQVWHAHHPVPSSHEVWFEPWAVYLASCKVILHLESTLLDHVMTQRLQRWWSTRPHSPPPQGVDWEALGAALKSMPITRRHWVSKHVAGICGVGTVLVQWNQQDSPTCPRCGHTEDAKHVWSCNHPSAVVQWESSLTHLQHRLDALQTGPDLQTAIVTALRQWKRGSPFVLQTDWPFLQRAFDDQSSMGWDSFLEGRLSPYWGDAQAMYYQWIQSRRSAKRWTVELIKKLLEVAWDQWEHRNGVAHRQSRSATQQLMDRQIEEQIRLGPRQLRGLDRRLFLQHRRIWQAQPSVRQAWLLNVRAALARLAPTGSTQRAQRSLMRRWLQT